jgi:NitT/TauT family transport system permease protein
MLISIVIASILGYLYVTAFFKPIVAFIIKLRFMSLLGFLFVFMTLLHDANSVKTAILTFSIVPFFTLSLVSMINRISQKEYDLWTTLRYNKWEQLYEVIIRGKADYVIEAIGANFAMGWLMMTIAESKSMADGGLGVLLFKYDKYNQLDKIFALQIIIFALGIFFDYTLKNIRHKIFPHTALVEKKN